jgi:hypothetical protein
MNNNANVKANVNANTNAAKIEKTTTNKEKQDGKTYVRQLHNHNTICGQTWTSCKCVHNKNK